MKGSPTVSPYPANLKNKFDQIVFRILCKAFRIEAYKISLISCNCNFVTCEVA